MLQGVPGPSQEALYSSQDMAGTVFTPGSHVPGLVPSHAAPSPAVDATPEASTTPGVEGSPSGTAAAVSVAVPRTFITTGTQTTLYLEEDDSVFILSLGNGRLC